MEAKNKLVLRKFVTFSDCLNANALTVSHSPRFRENIGKPPVEVRQIKCKDIL